VPQHSHAIQPYLTDARFDRAASPLLTIIGRDRDARDTHVQPGPPNGSRRLLHSFATKLRSLRDAVFDTVGWTNG